MWRLEILREHLHEALQPCVRTKMIAVFMDAMLFFIHVFYN